MTMLREFRRCTIHRSGIILARYNNGLEHECCKQCVFFEFEITMLLNILYLALMHPLEKRDDILPSRSQAIIQWLFDAHVMQKNSRYTDDDYLRHLRNGLAHLNIQIEAPVQGKIVETSEIVISGKNKKQTRVLCKFRFTINQLKKFVAFILNTLIDDKIIINNNCEECPHKDSVSFDSVTNTFVCSRNKNG
jgi:hypothetical protein